MSFATRVILPSRQFTSSLPCKGNYSISRNHVHGYVLRIITRQENFRRRHADSNTRFGLRLSQMVDHACRFQ